MRRADRSSSQRVKATTRSVPIDMERDGATYFVDDSACLAREQVIMVAGLGYACERCVYVPVVREVGTARGNESDEGEPGAVDKYIILQGSFPVV